MRILHALSRWNRDQQCGKNELNASPRAFEGMAYGKLAGEDEIDREVSALRKVQVKMSIRARYADAFGKEL